MMDNSALHPDRSAGGFDPRARSARLSVLAAIALASIAPATGCVDLLGIDDWERDGAPVAPATSPASSSSSSGDGGVGAVGGAGGQGGFLQENATCADAVKNGLETDIDCGGDSCGPCPKGKVCQNDADCVTGVCSRGTCGPALTMKPCPTEPDDRNPTCGDCVKNGYETDADCGGDSCGPCDEGQSCALDGDCKTSNCAAGKCGPKQPKMCSPVDPDNATCADCTQNGLETDEDCGGDACGPCALGKSCNVNADCATLHCNGVACDVKAPGCPKAANPNNPTCADCVKNGLETDVDCGGDSCAPCELGDSCVWDNDCDTLKCQGSVCVTL